MKYYWPDGLLLQNISQIFKTCEVVLRRGCGVICSTILVITFLASCKVTKPYQQPAGLAGDRLYRDISTSDTTTMASISWKEMFSDTLLQSLIGEAISNNPDLKVAMARIKSAAATARQSRLALLPGVDANAGAGFQRVPSTQFGFPEAYQLYISSSWEADIWGKLNSAKRAALASLLQSDAYKRAVQTQLVADIAANYYALMAYDAQLQVTERTVGKPEEGSGNDESAERK